MDFEIKMPRLGDEMVEGAIVEWIKEEGDEVTKGEHLLTIETPKTVVEVEAEVSGILKKILVPENTENVPVGQVIAIIETKD